MMAELFTRNKDLLPLATLLSAIERPGSYCASGRTPCPMLLLDVAGVGEVPFPVPDSVLEAMVEKAERAPFGWGEKTLLDRSVRDTWQFGPDEVSVGGRAWTETFQEILATVTEGLGCPSGSVEAELHKLLLYEQGGHFAPHRDTEKSDGMVATLVVSLPVRGKGGELVVWHKDRETRVDLRGEDPSELTYAAFYADCEHEVRPVTEGHRLSLVFNLVRTASTVPTAPDFRRSVDDIAEWLAAYVVATRSCERDPIPSPGWESLRHGVQESDEEEGAEDRPPEKLVWLLEHEYSETGLSYSALKNLDEAVARTLVEAAEQAGCEVHAAIFRMKRRGDAIMRCGDTFFEWDAYGRPTNITFDEDHVFDDSRWLESWAAPRSTRPEFGVVPIAPDEFIPSPYLDGIEAEKEEIDYPTANDGVTVERHYRLGALVLWPEERSVDVLGRGGVANAVNYLAYLRQKGVRQAEEWEGLRAHAERLISIWPEPALRERDEDWSKPCSAMIAELVQLGAPWLMKEFLAFSVLPNYTTDVQDAVCRAALVIGPQETGGLLGWALPLEVVFSPDIMIGLLSGLDRATRGGNDADWDTVLRDVARKVCDRHFGAKKRGDPREPKLRGQSVVRLFELFQRLGMVQEAGLATESLVAGDGRVDPYRELPAALDALERIAPGLGEARSVLWRYAVGRFLERSGHPPKEPENWLIRAEIPELWKGSRRGRSTARNWSFAECCRHLQDFCDDAAETTRQFPARKEIRTSLEGMIRRINLDMDCHTERSGNPHKLVCVKNRASHLRRLAEYADDVEFMQRLADQETASLSEAECRSQLRDAIRRGKDSREQ